VGCTEVFIAKRAALELIALEMGLLGVFEVELAVYQATQKLSFGRINY
jgi:hypothetical protein